MDETKLAEKGFEKLFQKKAKPDYYALFAHALREETVEDAGVVYEEGDASDGLYLIINGKIRLRNPENDSESVREAGDVFGTAGILRARAKREETALAAGEAAVAFLSREEFERLTGETPDLGRWLERSLLLHENERRKTAEDDREKRRKSARAIFLALLPLAWAVIWDGLIEKFAGEGTLPPAAMMALFLGIAVLVTLFFFAGRFSKRELGLDAPARLRTWLILLAATAELSALFFLAVMLEDNGVLSGFAAPGGGSVTGGGALLFLGMSLFHTAVFLMSAGVLPDAAETLVGGKAGRFAAYLVPLAVAIPIYAALEGAAGALWLGLLTLTFLFVRRRTGDLMRSAVFFLLASAVGAFGFGLLIVPSMF